MHLRVRGRITIVAEYSVSGGRSSSGHRIGAHRAYVPAPLWSLTSSYERQGDGPAASCGNGFPVVLGAGSHPFPFRTRKLSLFPPMVLRA